MDKILEIIKDACLIIFYIAVLYWLISAAIRKTKELKEDNDFDNQK